jgi:glutamate racemase
MGSPSPLEGRSGPVTVVLTDSGLGGLLISAGLERRLRRTESEGMVRLIYVNAWPDAAYGYNDLPDLTARAAVFDRALAAMMSFHPGLILIACNTLSVVYGETAFGRAPAVPVKGIIDAGTDLFYEALARDPSRVLALFGTRTTIGSGEHARRLMARGIAPARIVAEPCHGLAAAIDKDPDSAVLPGLVEECVLRAVPRFPAGSPVAAGLACTHFGYVTEAFRASLVRHTRADVEVLDPGERLIEGITRGLGERRPGAGERGVSVEVISKIGLGEAQCRAVARRLEPVSACTAEALIGYNHAPDLF